MSLVARAANRFGYLPADPTVAIRAQADLWQALLPLYHPGLIPTPPPGASNYPLLPQAPRAETSAYTITRANLPLILPPVVVPLPPGDSTGYPNPRGVDQGAAQFSITAYSQITPTGQQVRLFSYITSSYITGIVIGSTPPPPVSALIFSNYDWPVPGALRATNDNSWVQGFQIQLEIQSAPPQQNYDWSNPNGAQFPLEERTWLQGLQLQLSAQTSPPPINTDWSNPLGAQFPLEERTWLQGFPLLLSNKPSPPQINTDWPNPSIPGFPLEERTWLQGFQIQLVARTSVPPQSYDYPNPGVVRFPLDGLTWIQGFQAQLIPGSRNLVPRLGAFTRYNPLDPYVAINAQANQDIALPIQPPIPVLPPFIYDYPNPRGAAQPTTNKTWFQGLSPLYARFLIPFSYDYQNPRAKPQAVTNSTWTQGSPIWLFTKPTPPQANYDQPNPRAPVFVITNRTWTNPPPNPTPLRPFPVLLWPNPEQKRYVVKDFVNYHNMLLTTSLIGYVTEDGLQNYVDETGTNIYVKEDGT